MARKILLADDSVTAQNMGRKILADAGYEVITVNNGSAALKRISEQRPDVIVLDVYMPGYSGLEVCQRLKEGGETARIPILLTVGKLEPFKPEEVKRVRADAFIIKPFEASELLSALSKLEDRVVPRTEASKPGRFARAAMDQVPYDKTMAIEEDTTWKNRIAFPSKKKAKEPEPDEPVETQSSKDLQSVIEKKLAETPAPVRNERVDLGALAPAGLPKDVTPEEIAALAAAAAQMQGRIADGRYVSPGPHAEPQKAEVKEEPKPVEAQQVEAITVGAEKVVEAKPVEQAEANERETPAPASFADQVLAGAPADQPSGKSIPSSGNGTGKHESPAANADEPVTMAVASMADSKEQDSRWTAVAVALAPEEAALSLEREMQEAFAALTSSGGGNTVASKTFAEAGAPVQSSTEVAIPAATPVATSAAPGQMQTSTNTAAAETESVSETDKPVARTEASAAEPVPTTAKLDIGSQTTPVRSFEVAATPAPTTDAQTVETVSAPSSELAGSTQIKSVSTPKADESLAAHSPVEQEATREARPEETPDPSQPLPDLAAIAAAALTELQNAQPGRTETGSTSESKTAPQDTAAKAVAVGAESRPEDVIPPDSDPGIASIVDSVLADLRPKIVEEISKKLGKKK